MVAFGGGLYSKENESPNLLIRLESEEVVLQVRAKGFLEAVGLVAWTGVKCSLRLARFMEFEYNSIEWIV